MGSKRVMLQNGLGSLILEESKNAKRVVDLFCGAGSVVGFASTRTERPVLAVDLQEYSIILAKAILRKVSPIDSEELEKKWILKAENMRKGSPIWSKAQKLSSKVDMRRVRYYVEECRKLCEEKSEIGPILNAYGGYYFSPEQALTFDYLLSNLPKNEDERIVCQASIIIAAMRCVASPGHTAQPFQPTKTAGRFIIESWKRDPLEVCKKTLKEVCLQYARTLGEAYVGNAIDEAGKLKSSDLVFVDPPYTGVQYSRFYHVLETLARCSCGPVSGAGRYTAITDRPQSEFSNPGQSEEALKKLLSNLANSGSTVIFTFPEGECSNGLSGETVLEKAKGCFHIEKKIVKGKFSTLGGNKKKRDSRKDSSELILLMRPK
ncbi:MAG: DNA adenine methylase [Candidatus Omnitrophica bacterium]|nr:DNA adenine methylase [Candidatus Omnitrophota bacterium]